MYALAERYRHASVNPAELANQLYRPSYLSREWALGFYGVIPEMVVTYTSVTTRVPRCFSNDFGRFEYRHIKQDAFFGYRALQIQGYKVMLATPEKALLDLWYLSAGPWTLERMAAMRFQNGESIDKANLDQYAERFESPRLSCAVGVWHEFIDAEQRGTVML
jgi:predicted transcriptional regulator of viral defense system